MALDILIRLLGQDTNVKPMLKGIGDAADRVTDRIKKVGDSSGFKTAEAKAKDYWAAVDEAKGKTDNLNRSLEGVRNAAAGFAIAGAAGMLLAEHMASAYLEADRLGGKLESLMSAKGLSANVDEVKKLGNEIAGLTGGDDDTVSAAIGKAIASGRVAGLRDYGIQIDAAGMAAIEAAGKISDSAKAQETFNQVMRAGGAAVKELKSNTSEATQSIGEMGVRWGNLEEGIGEGAARIKASFYEGVLSPIFDIIEKSPELQTTVGMVLSIGSAALTTGGSVIGLAAQVGMTMFSMQSMGITGVVAFNAVTAAAARTALVVGKVLLVALLAAAALYALDKLMHRKEDAELAANIKAGEGKDDESLKILNESRRKRGLAPLAKNNETGTEEEDKGDFDAIQRKYDALQKDTGAMPVDSAAMPSAASIPAISPSVASIIGTADVDEDGDVDAKDAKKQKRDAIKASAKSERAAAKSQKDIERANLKEAKALENIAKTKENRADKLQDYQADIEKAKINEEAETLTAGLEAQRPKKGTDAALESRIAAIKASQERRIADIEARSVEDDDPQRAASIRQIASIRAQGTLDRAGIAKGGGNSIANTIAALRAGKGIGAINQSGGNMATGASSGGGDVMAGQPTYRQDSGGTWWVKFPDLKLPDGGYRRDAMQFSR